MPWTRARLRNQTVFARVKAGGEFDASGGRVEIRYRANDPRVYRATPKNLERIDGEPILPDDHCVPGDEAPAAPSASSSREPSPGSQTLRQKEQLSQQRKAQAAQKALAPGAIPKDAWTVYVDGACSGNPGPAGLGMVVIDPSGNTTEGYEYLGVATNNIAELTAILRASQNVPRDTAAVVHTDSQYSIGVLEKGWKPKANQELIAQVKSALAGRKKKLVLRYVPGHHGVPLNERADELAREAVSSRSSHMPEAPPALAAPQEIPPSITWEP
jgi:ribonuclease HI